MRAPQRIDRKAYLATTAELQRSVPKYRNHRIEVDGVTFDSKREHAIWEELRLRERVGEIHDLKRQQRYPLVVNGVKIAALQPDYDYIDSGGLPVSADCKGGAPTRDWLIKAKLFHALYGREIVILR